MIAARLSAPFGRCFKKKFKTTIYCGFEPLIPSLYCGKKLFNGKISWLANF